jgi:uncharacterized protein DUF4407
MRRMRRFLIFCSGADTTILAECPTEMTKYAGIGATIVFTAVLAGLSGGYALFTVFRSLWTALTFALLWALMIFNLDRVIISGMRKQVSFKRDLLYASPRLVLAMLLAVVISKPLELRLFESEIQAKITQTRNEQYQRTVRTVAAGFAELDDLEAQNRDMQKAIDAKQQEVDQAHRELIAEVEGSGGTLLRGSGPVAAEKQRRLDKVDEQLKILAKASTDRIGQNEKRIAELRKERQHRVDVETADLAAADGFLARLEALGRLASENFTIRLASLFITLLLIALETAPVLVKLLSTLSPYRPYEQKLEDREWQIVETSRLSRLALASKLELERKRDVSAVSASTDTDLAISSEKNRLRREAELQANELLMRRIADAQTEIVERIIEKWKDQEIEKLETNREEFIKVA